MKKLRMAGIILVAVGVFKGLATACALDPSGKIALWTLIISMAAAKIKPAMKGFMFFKVVLMMKLSLFLNKNLKTKYNKTNDGNTIEIEASKEPNIPPT